MTTNPNLRHVAPVRLARPRERWVYALAGGVLLSGLLWLLFEHFVRVASEFGPEHHWLQAWWLKLHGSLALAAVWGFGVLWPIHVRRAWNAHRHRRSGGTLFGTVSFLAITGLLLYYTGDDRLRAWVSLGHWIVGLLGVLVLGTHIVIARRLHPARAADAP